MNVKRFATFAMAAAGALVFAAGGAAYLLSGSYGGYKSSAETTVEAATGRKLVIDGPLTLKLLPAPSFVAERVRFANASWGSSPNMATVERVEARIALWPLVSGNLEITQLQLVQPVILIETNSDGRGNWQMGPSQAGRPADTTLDTLFVFGDVTIAEGRIMWRDGPTGGNGEIAIKTFTARPAAGAIDMAFAGDVHGRVLNASATVEATAPASWSFSNVAVTYGDTAFAGTLAIDLLPAAAQVSARLETPELNLAALAEDIEAATPAGRPAGDRFRNRELPLDLLKSFDADLALKAKRVIAGALAFDDATLSLALRDGRLEIASLEAALGAGTLDGAGTIDSAGRLTTRLVGDNLAAEELAAALGAPDLLAGKAALDLRLKGQGRTWNQVVASLDGTAGFVMKRGMLNNGYFDLLGADLLRMLASGGGATTPVNCIVAPFDVRSGVARTDAFLLDTDRVTVRGVGSIDLRAETLDFLFAPQPKDASLLSLATPIRVSGALASPSAYPDPAGLAGNIAGALASGAVLGPAGLLLPLLGGQAEAPNPCIGDLMRRAADAPGAATESGGAEGAIRQLGSDIEKGLKGIFGR